jgi:aldehyde dehydrogenase (NAD+)
MAASKPVLKLTPLDSIPQLVASTRAVFNSGRTRPLAWRQAQLRQLLRLVRENEAAIAAAIKADLGRCLFEVVVAEMYTVIKEAEHALAHLHSWAAPEAAATPSMFAPSSSYILKEPLGVVSLSLS